LRTCLVFRDITFEGKGKIVFMGVDMSRVSLMFVDLSRVEFRNVRWWSYGEAFMTIDAVALLAKTNEGFARRYARKARRWLDRLLVSLDRGVVPEVLEYWEEEIRKAVEEELRQKKPKGTSWSEFEEQVKEEIKRETLTRLKDEVRSWRNQRLTPSPDDPDLTLENVLQELRNLKEWHISRGRYEEAARFHVAEMDVRRLMGRERERHLVWPPKGLWGRLKDRVSAWVEKRLLWLYRALCLYGESVARPFLWLVLLWLAFGLLYAFSGLAATGLAATPELAALLQLLADGLAFSASVIALMLLVRAPPVVAAWGYMAWAEAALALLIYVVLAPTLMRRIWRLVRV